MGRLPKQYWWWEDTQSPGSEHTTSSMKKPPNPIEESMPKQKTPCLTSDKHPSKHNIRPPIVVIRKSIEQLAQGYNLKRIRTQPS